MTKFARLQTDVFSIFASNLWTAEGIKTYPQNTVIIDKLNEFVRVSIVSSGEGLNKNSVSGLIIAEIFYPAGNGPSRGAAIADKLDKHLSQKSISTTSGATTQLFVSSLVYNGVDRDNPSLVKSTFSIPFLHFGVQ